jgi:hypothetical protein
MFSRLTLTILLIPAIPGAVILGFNILARGSPEYWQFLTASLFVSWYVLALLTLALLWYGRKDQSRLKNRLLLLAIAGGWLFPQFWIMLAYLMTGGKMVAYPFVFRGDSALMMWVYSATFGSAGTWVFSFPFSFIIVYSIASSWFKTRE